MQLLRLGSMFIPTVTLPLKYGNKIDIGKILGIKRMNQGPGRREPADGWTGVWEDPWRTAPGSWGGDAGLKPFTYCSSSFLLLLLWGNVHSRQEYDLSSLWIEISVRLAPVALGNSMRFFALAIREHRQIYLNLCWLHGAGIRPSVSQLHYYQLI